MGADLRFRLHPRRSGLDDRRLQHITRGSLRRVLMDEDHRAHVARFESSSGTSRSSLGVLAGPGVGYVLIANRTHIIGHHCGHGNRATIECKELHLVAFAALVHVYHRARVTGHETLLRQIAGERDPLELADHVFTSFISDRPSRTWAGHYRAPRSTRSGSRDRAVRALQRPIQHVFYAEGRPDGV